MALGPAEFLERDLLAGDGLHHVRAGDEHMRGLIDHEDEVGHGRAVHRTAGTWAEDHRDLRGDTRGLHVAVEDAAVAGQRNDALLDAGTGTIVQADERRTHGEGEIHDLVDLLGEDLTERSTEHGEVLGEHEHLAAVDGSPAGDDTVGVGALLDTALMGTMTGEHVELMEGPLVEEIVDPLTGKHLALCVLAFDRTLRTGMEGLFLALSQFGEAFSHGMFRHGTNTTDMPKGGRNGGGEPLPGRGPTLGGSGPQACGTSSPNLRRTSP